MCIAFITRRTLHIALVEQIWLEVGLDGTLSVRECYDVFFRAPHNHAAVTDAASTEPMKLDLFAVYPHRILDDKGKLKVDFEIQPGAKVSEFDSVYSKCQYTGATNSVALEIPESQSSPSTPDYVSLNGTFIVPSFELPEKLAKSPGAIRLMSEVEGDHHKSNIPGLIGTLFSISIPGLTPGADYVFRLVISPLALRGTLQATNPREPDGSEGTTYWQPLSITAPHALLAGFRELIERTAALTNTEAKKGAISFQEVLAHETGAEHLRAAVIETHRLYVIYPPEFLSIDTSRAAGSMIDLGPCQFEDSTATSRNVNGVEWRGGAGLFPADEPFALARNILKYFREFGTDAKSIADIGNETRCVDSANVGVLVNALCQERLIQSAGSGFYLCGPKCTASVKEIEAGAYDHIIDKVLFHDGVEQSFSRRNFDIKYVAIYRYASARLRRKMRWRELRNSIAFLLAVASIVLTLYFKFAK